MADDRMLADLLGGAPKAPDPGFRLDVFARMAARKRRRASLERGALIVAASTAVGLGAAVAQSAGLSLDAALPMLDAAGVLGLAGLFALVVIAGPRALVQGPRRAAAGVSRRL